MIYERQELHNDSVGFIIAARLIFWLISDLGKLNGWLMLSQDLKDLNSD